MAAHARTYHVNRTALQSPANHCRASLSQGLMVLAVFLCLFPLPVRAGTPPAPQHKSDLALMQQKLENEKRLEAILHKKLENVESDLEKTRVHCSILL